jgi:hypothetical protein
LIRSGLPSGRNEPKMTQRVVAIPTCEQVEKGIDRIAKARFRLRDMAARADYAFQAKDDEIGREASTKDAKAISDYLKETQAEMGDWLTIIEALTRRGSHKVKKLQTVDDWIDSLQEIRAQIEAGE